jgi:hypothetical protein
MLVEQGLDFLLILGENFMSFSLEGFLNLSELFRVILPSLLILLSHTLD